MTDFHERYQAAVATAEKILRNQLDSPMLTGEDCFLIITKSRDRETTLRAINALLKIEDCLESLIRYSHDSIFCWTIYGDPMRIGIAQKLIEARKDAPTESDLTEWAWLLYQTGGARRNLFSLLREEGKDKKDPYLWALLSVSALIHRHPVLNTRRKVPKEEFTAIFLPKMLSDDDSDQRESFVFLGR